MTPKIGVLFYQRPASTCNRNYIESKSKTYYYYHLRNIDNLIQTLNEIQYHENSIYIDS